MKKEEFNCDLMTDEIEFYSFGAELRRAGYKLASLAIVDSMTDEGDITFREQ